MDFRMISSVNPQKNFKGIVKCHSNGNVHTFHSSRVYAIVEVSEIFCCVILCFFETLTFITFPYTAKHQTLGLAPKNFFLKFS